MAHEEINLNGLNFPVLFDNTPFNTAVDVTAAAIKTAFKDEKVLPPPITDMQFDEYVETLRIDNKISSWDDFIQGWRSFIGVVEPDSQTGPVFELFAGKYREALSIGTTGFMGVDDPVAGDWSLLASGAMVDADTVKQQFVNAFNHFVTTLAYDSLDAKSVFDDTSPRGTLADQLEEFLGIIAVMQDGTPIPGGLPDIATYQQVYEAFFPDASAADFEDALVEFYNERLKENGSDEPLNGYFIPSMEFARWFEKIQSEFSIALTGSPTITRTSLASANFRKISILLRIFKLLADMIEVLQRVASAQASRLRFLTEWQRAYTDALQQIHVFGTGTQDRIGGVAKGTPEEEVLNRERGNLNTQRNAAWQELIRGSRDVIKDDAKSLQSTVNQTNDAVNQQASLATSILQQFSTILSALFR